MTVRILKTIALLIACTSTFAGYPEGTRTGAPFEITQSGFEVLRQGTFGNAGQNLYVSARGRIQFVHRWDLNNDGYYDLVFNNTHNRMDVPDVTAFVAAIIQADQLGVSMSKILRIQSDQMRVKRRQKAQEKAHQAPVKLMLPP